MQQNLDTSHAQNSFNVDCYLALCLKLYSFDTSWHKTPVWRIFISVSSPCLSKKTKAKSVLLFFFNLLPRMLHSGRLGRPLVLYFAFCFLYENQSFPNSHRNIFSRPIISVYLHLKNRISFISSFHTSMTSVVRLQQGLTSTEAEREHCKADQDQVQLL